MIYYQFFYVCAIFIVYSNRFDLYIIKKTNGIFVQTFHDLRGPEKHNDAVLGPHFTESFPVWQHCGT